MTRQALSATIDGVSTNLYAYDGRNGDRPRFSLEDLVVEVASDSWDFLLVQLWI